LQIFRELTYGIPDLDRSQNLNRLPVKYIRAVLPLPDSVDRRLIESRAQSLDDANSAQISVLIDHGLQDKISLDPVLAGGHGIDGSNVMCLQAFSDPT
jgi:hypothetical protein